MGANWRETALAGRSQSVRRLATPSTTDVAQDERVGVDGTPLAGNRRVASHNKHGDRTENGMRSLALGEEASLSLAALVEGAAR